jgi:squalene synthase HpnC
MTNAIETPSGKGAGDENFPVGSFLLPRRLRPHVAVFYAFARAADDIGDNPELSAEDKLSRLAALDAVFVGEGLDDPARDKAIKVRRSLEQCGVTVQHCRDLLAAFSQDAVKSRYASWGELMGYCRLSASPVGRYLLDLHGESQDDWPPSDALCDALQVLNHLQDCKDDYRTLDRVYLPEDWMAAEGTGVEDLVKDRATPGMRHVLDRCLDGVDELLVRAAPLPGRMKSRSLAMESAVILGLARRLAELLRRNDPIAGRVKLSKLDFIVCGLRGVWKGLFPVARGDRTVARGTGMG